MIAKIKETTIISVIIIAFTLGLIGVLAVGCIVDYNYKEAPALEAHASNGKALGHDRFRIVEGSYDYQAILVDTETGVEYFWICPNGYAGGLTVLVDYTGQPLIAPGFKDY